MMEMMDNLDISMPLKAGALSAYSWKACIRIAPSEPDEQPQY